MLKDRGGRHQCSPEVAPAVFAVRLQVDGLAEVAGGGIKVGQTCSGDDTCIAKS
jgi:hypothetical protein